MTTPYMNSAQGDSVGFRELAAACAVSLADLRELMDYGALAPLQPPPTEPVFATSYVEPLRLAGIARRDYDLDLFVVVILMDYLQRIAQLESQLCTLKAQRPLAH